MSLRRPPAPIRYVVLLSAVALLTGVVCTRQQTRTSPELPGNAAEPAAPVDSTAPADQAPATPDAGVAAPPAPPPEVFPATKSPGKLF